jgi:hypothetical protein
MECHGCAARKSVLSDATRAVRRHDGHVGSRNIKTAKNTAATIPLLALARHHPVPVVSLASQHLSSSNKTFKVPHSVVAERTITVCKRWLYAETDENGLGGTHVTVVESPVALAVAQPIW